MHILLTNDDGYASKGINCLAKHLSKNHEVTVVAPECEMSCSSHSVNFLKGVTYRKIDNKDGICTYAVNGTPADCVLFSIYHLLKDKKVDLVVSGVNNCLNVGSDYIYSGTVGAAQEATYLRHKGVAVSLDTKNTDDYDEACGFFADNVEKFAEFATNDITINVNIPHTNFKDIAGVKVAPIAYRPYKESFASQIFDDGREVYIASGSPISQKDSGIEDDGSCVDNGYITVTPIRLLGNCPETLQKMRNTSFKL
ncbi:MAG: 5'/3'-nucleotidase SurE [Clostridia bacterium]